MPKVPEGCKLVLFPHDDFNHAPDPVPNYNESMYFSVFDPGLGMGGWCRIGNRVNEGHAEMTQCVYLPDGRVAFMAMRPKIQSNEKMDAGGLRFEIEKPFERIRVTYEGKLCLLERPREMADPSRAFRENPSVECRMDVVHTPAAPPIGGEIVHLDGSPLPLDPNKGFGRAHYEQFMAGEGTLELEGKSYRLRGHGLRDKTWGPRYWQNIDWYRWVHVRFGPELALAGTISDYGDGQRCSGFAATPGGDLRARGRRSRERVGRRPVPDAPAFPLPHGTRQLRARGTGALADPAAQPPAASRRALAADADHRGHDRVPLERPNRPGNVRVPGSDRGRPTVGRGSGLTAWKTISQSA